MSAFPATTVRVTAIEPASDTKVRITLEMIVDVNRLAEVSSEMLRATVKRRVGAQEEIVSRVSSGTASSACWTAGRFPRLRSGNLRVHTRRQALAFSTTQRSQISSGNCCAREGEQGAADAAALMRGRDPELVEIEIARMKRQHGDDLVRPPRRHRDPSPWRLLRESRLRSISRPGSNTVLSPVEYQLSSQIRASAS